MAQGHDMQDGQMGQGMPMDGGQQDEYDDQEFKVRYPIDCTISLTTLLAQTSNQD